LQIDKEQCCRGSAGNEEIMEPYAVIQTGGKQYRVQKNTVLDVELLDAEKDSSVTLTDVLAVSDGSKLTVGTPLVQGAAVTATVIEQFRGKKVVAFKKKRRKGYKRKVGHRQDLMRVKIDAINAG
jgi:large subunit ribosomal protein L21